MSETERDKNISKIKGLLTPSKHILTSWKDMSAFNSSTSDTAASFLNFLVEFSFQN